MLLTFTAAGRSNVFLSSDTSLGFSNPRKLRESESTAKKTDRRTEGGLRRMQGRERGRYEAASNPKRFQGSMPTLHENAVLNSNVWRGRMSSIVARQGKEGRLEGACYTPPPKKATNRQCVRGTRHYADLVLKPGTGSSGKYLPLGGGNAEGIRIGDPPPQHERQQDP